MARGIARFFTTPATLEPYLGSDSASVDQFGPAITVTGFLDGKRQMVRTSDGEQEVASATFYCPLTPALATIPTNSRLTVGGKPSRVLSSSANGGIPNTALPDHVAIALQ